MGRFDGTNVHCRERKTEDSWWLIQVEEGSVTIIGNDGDEQFGESQIRVHFPNSTPQQTGDEQ